MTSARLLRVGMVLRLLDVGCLAFGKPQRWLFSWDAGRHDRFSRAAHWLWFISAVVYIVFERVEDDEDTLLAMDGVSFGCLFVCG